jgi:membrane protease YdiL (CAAX protease family)
LTPPDQNRRGNETSGLDPEALAPASLAAPLGTDSGTALPLWRRVYVWVVFGVILCGWPLAAFLATPDNLSDQALYISAARESVYLNTGLMLWLMFFLVWSAQRAAGRPLRAIGFEPPRMADPLIAAGFLVGANIILNGLAWGMKSAGFEVPDLAMKALLPVTSTERITWVLLSISAGICEESCFRGFLLCQGKHLVHWTTPLVIASSLAFGVGHLYQGVAGGMLIFVYGVLFCWLRLWRGSLWPGIWAHIWQDVAAMVLGGWVGQ